MTNDDRYGSSYCDIIGSVSRDDLEHPNPSVGNNYWTSRCLKLSIFH